MSTLVTANLSAPGGMGGMIQIPPSERLVGASAGAFQATGLIIQTVVNQSHNRTTYSSPPSGNGTQITDLNLTISPKRAGSIIICEWRIAGELHHDNVWTVLKNGSLTNGYNLNAGNNRWSGYHTQPYDGDTNSTPEPAHILYWDSPGSTASVTYAPACRCSNGSTYTFALNRTTGSSGQWGHENGVSVGIAWEVAV
jgi:hypothetical protein